MNLCYPSTEHPSNVCSCFRGDPEGYWANVEQGTPVKSRCSLHQGCAPIPRNHSPWVTIRCSSSMSTVESCGSPRQQLFRASPFEIAFSVSCWIPCVQEICVPSLSLCHSCPPAIPVHSYDQVFFLKSPCSRRLYCEAKEA